MKAVQLLIESRLPPELRDYNREYTAKSIGSLLSDLAVSYPDKYDEVSRLIGDTGRNSSYWQGDTIKLSDLKPVFDKEPLLAQMRQEIASLPRDDPKFEDQRQAVWIRYNEEMQRLTNEAGATSDNSIARAVLSGARGKPDQMKMMLTAPGLYSNSKGVVPLFISHSFGEGLRPAEYLASTYGARDSIVKIKTATAKGGDFGKQIAQTAATTIVTTKDCGTDNGLDLDLADPSLRGRVLAKAVGGLGVGTVLDRSALQQLEKEKVTTVIARSAMTCNAGTGVCQQCIGKFHDQRFPKIGEAVGVTAAHAISEPVCLDGDTLVRMSDRSTKRIKDILPGELVLGSDMQGNLTPTRVVNVFHNGPRPCVRTVVRKGRGQRSEQVEMVSTKEHKTLCSQEWKRFNPKIQPIEYKIKNGLNVCMSRGVSGLEGKHEPWAGLLGLLVGDGAYGGTNRGVSLSCYEPETLAWAKVECIKNGCYLKHAAHGEYRINISDPKSVRNRVKHPLKLKLMEENMWGCTSGNKKLPDSIHTWDNESVAAFIGGYLAADGWVTKTGVIGFGSVSEDLIKGLKDILEFRFGLYCNRITSHRKPKEGGGHYRPSYETTIGCRPDIIHFADTIPIPGVKHAKLKDVIARWKPSVYNRGSFKVIEQTSVGIRDTWDIEVDNDTHLFALANGMIVSNTQGSLGCLTDDTLVRMADFTTKRIDQIKVGDMVLGSDVKARTLPVKVLQVWDKGLQPVKRRVFTQPELAVDCTDDHIMLLSDAQGVLSKQPAGTPGEVLAPIVGLPHPLPRTAVEDLGLLHCMDISVDHPDELFVLANGLIVKNSKHSGGQTTGKKEYSGFNVINQLVQSPEEFPDRALVSEESGTVSSVEEAPQGGFIVTVGESQHYVPQGYPVMVKSGDQVEAGDQLSEGLIDAGDIVRLRGLGSGRRYFADRLHRVLEDSGFGGDKRNVEIVSRSVIDHARVEDDQNLPGTLPDDQISYNRLSQTYTPPASSKRLPTADTVGQYLQSPALHYSIGTRLSPSQVKRLQTSGYTHLEVSPEEPGFRTEMQRLRTSTQTNPDWLARQGASYLKSNLLEGAVRGQDTNIQSNIHFGPRLAFGKDFGKNTATTGEF